MSKIPLSVTLWFAALPFAAGAASPATDAFGVLDRNCSVCHGPRAPASAFMLLDHAALIAGGKVVPGNSAASPLYQRIIGQGGPRMPMGGARLPDTDIATIRHWIDAGAPPWGTPEPIRWRFLSNDEVFARIVANVKALGRDDRKFARYFLLTNASNAGADEARLNLYRKGLGKLLNMLSWQKDIALPVAIDRKATIFRVDLRWLDWTQSKWRTIIEGYPYAVVPPTPDYAEIQRETGTTVPVVQAAWFAAAASLAPLYSRLLDLPTAQEQLENCGDGVKRCLNIDSQRILRDAAGVLVLAVGFVESGVSSNSRLVYRFETPFGGYYISRDFATNVGFQNPFLHPLDYVASGGEALFTLPNGLLGSALFDGQGRLIKVAPTAIVSNKRPQGKPEVRNAQSCMLCHSTGLLPLRRDDMGPSLAVLPSEQRAYARRLFAGPAQFNEKRLEDQKHFEAALAKLGIHEDEEEPVNALADSHNQSLDAVTAASQFGLPKDSFLRQIATPTFKEFGLDALLEGGTVKRDAFEDVYGRAAEALGLGHYCAPTRAYGERAFLKPLASTATEETGGCLEGRQK